MYRRVVPGALPKVFCFETKDVFNIGTQPPLAPPGQDEITAEAQSARSQFFIFSAYSASLR